MNHIVRRAKVSLRKLMGGPHSNMRQEKVFKTVIARDRNRQSFYKIKKYFSTFNNEKIENNQGKISNWDFEKF